MVEKEYISAQSLLIDSYKLAKKVLDSGFKPDFIVGVWRGGAPIGIAVQEYMEYNGVKADHIAIRTSAYEGINNMKKEINVHGLGYLVDNANAEDKLLIVDDVFDTGLSMEAVINSIEEKSRKNKPEIRVATAYFKPDRNQTLWCPDFYINETNNWIIFPHELIGLEKEEIVKKGKDIANLF